MSPPLRPRLALLVSLAGLLLARCDCAPLQPGALFVCEADGSCPEGKRCRESDWLCVPVSPEADGGEPDACVRETCRPGDCGARPDGCGDTLECGGCEAPLVCGESEPNRCACPAGSSPSGSEAACDDRVDNDCDGLSDCQDPDCDGRGCDDGDLCTEDDRCGGGACSGAPVACASPPGQCHEPTGTCAPKGGCYYSPRDAGFPCNDGAPCTTGDACNGAGSCSGTAVRCEAPPGPQCYEAGVCGADGGCSYAPMARGFPCVDGDACTTGDICDGAGSCSGDPVSCTTPPGSCFEATGSCGTDGGCAYSPRPSGTSCVDTDPCTTGESCNGAGSCVGVPVSCVSPPNTQCYGPTGTCSPDAGCTYATRAVGTPCNDGDNCTWGDACTSSGACRGTAFQCGNPPNLRCYGSTGTCNPDGGCTYTPHGNGTPCNDGLACTSNDTCQNGVCLGSDSCSAPPNWQCYMPVGRCTANGCEYAPYSDGTICVYAGTMCGGVAKNCYTCQGGVCTHNAAEYDGACVPKCATLARYCGANYTCCTSTYCTGEPASDCAHCCPTCGGT